LPAIAIGESPHSGWESLVTPQAHTTLEIKDCALIALADGRRAQSLKELRDGLRTASASSLYCHFWGGLLRPGFGEREYNNDFAAWARHGLHEKTLAERLAVVDPTTFPDMEALREELIEILDDRLDETDRLICSASDQQFEFVYSQIVVFRTARVLRRPVELTTVVEQLSVGSVFYHFIDARRRRQDGLDSFCAWLRHFGEEHGELVEHLGRVDPYFSTLVELRTELARIVKRHFSSEVL
jgi:hypothetical protein